MSKFPDPVPGLVIRFSFLWRHEARRGQTEGRKDRPCAVVLTHINDAGFEQAWVLPITHSAPENPKHGVPMPAKIKRRLGLDDIPSWVVVADVNRFIWPGPDIRLARPNSPTPFAYGLLPSGFFELIKARFLDVAGAGHLKLTDRDA